METVVIGAGVIGVTTAYKLAKVGHQVTVIDANAHIASQSSAANGGQLSYDFAAPIGNPALLRKIPSILAGKDIGFRMRKALDRQYVGWSVQFLKNCLPRQSKTNSEKLTDLVKISRLELQNIVSETGVEFSHRRAGKLVIYEDQAAFDIVRRSQNTVTKKNGGVKYLDADQCRSLEPVLVQRRAGLAGGVYAQGDDVGDAAIFAQKLARHCRDHYGTQFLFDQPVAQIVEENGRVKAARLANGDTIEARRIICCVGAYGGILLRSLGIRLPIFPIKGYSITAPLGSASPKIAITEASRRLVYSRLGNFMRIAGFADFTPAHQVRDKSRIRMMWQSIREAMPEIADFDKINNEWVGYRPSTPDSLPIIGPTRVKNLYLNMGHGMFGWTLAAGSAQVLVQSIDC